MHLFHFKINKDDYNLIMDLKQKSGKQSMRTTMIFLIETSKNIIKSLYKTSSNHKSKKPTDNERKISMFINILESDYRMFKHYHSNKNVFSIAEILRKCIEIFREGLKVHSFDDFIKLLKKTKKVNLTQCINEFKKTIHMLNEFTVNITILYSFVIFLTNYLKC